MNSYYSRRVIIFARLFVVFAAITFVLLFTMFAVVLSSGPLTGTLSDVFAFSLVGSMVLSLASLWIGGADKVSSYLG